MYRFIMNRVLTVCVALCLLSCSQTSKNDLAVASVSAPSAIHPDDVLVIGITVTNRNASQARTYVAQLQYDIFGTALASISQSQTGTVRAGSVDTVTFTLSMAEIELGDGDQEFHSLVDITYQKDQRTTVGVGHSLGNITIEK